MRVDVEREHRLDRVHAGLDAAGSEDPNLVAEEPVPKSRAVLLLGERQPARHAWHVTSSGSSVDRKVTSVTTRPQTVSYPIESGRSSWWTMCTSGRTMWTGSRSCLSYWAWYFQPLPIRSTCSCGVSVSRSFSSFVLVNLRSR